MKMMTTMTTEQHKFIIEQHKGSDRLDSISSRQDSFQSAHKVTALGLSVKLPMVFLRFIPKNSKAPNCDGSKLLRLTCKYTRDLSPKVRTKSRPMCRPVFSPTELFTLNMFNIYCVYPLV